MNWDFEGKCWKFGNNVGIDGDIMPLEFALKRETRPEVLREHLMKGINPEFAKKVSSGDIIVAGKRFGQGNPHIQGFMAIAAHSLGLVVESIPRGSFRNAIIAGVPILAHCEGVTEEVDQGDKLKVNFKIGLFRNLTRGTERQYEPLDSALLRMLEAGGWKAMVLRRLKEIKLHP